MTREHAIALPFPIRRTINILLACVAAALVVYLFHNIDDLMWDFRTYYYAALAYKTGLDPYHLGTLRGLSDAAVFFDYVYPPLTLTVFVPFTKLDYHTAAVLFLILKLVAVGGLLLLWIRAFLKEHAGPLFYAFFLLAFNATVYRDVEAGNIATFEVLLLWWSFVLFRDKRYNLFALICVAAATFKLFPALFLGLLLWTDDPKKWIRFTVFAMLFACVIAFSQFLEPEFFERFLENAWGSAAGVGAFNPSFPALFRDLLTRMTSLVGWTAPSLVTAGAALLWVACCTVVSFIAIRRAGARGRLSSTTLVYLGCLLFALIHPRFKDYAYVLLIVPAFEVVREYCQRYAGRRALGNVAFIGLIFFCAVPTKSPLPWMQQLFEYAPFFAVLGLWLMALSQLRTLKKAARSEE